MMDSDKGKKFENGILQILNNLNTFNESNKSAEKHLDFIVCGKKVGVVLSHIAETLKTYENCFTVKDDIVSIHSEFATNDAITKAVEGVLLDLKARKVFKCLDGWRSEHYDVRPRYSQEPVFKLERAAATLFGIKQYGCHINGYIKKDGLYFMWIARRSKTKQTYPSMLDNFTAGGLTAGLSPSECAIKELEEEAGCVGEAAAKLKPVSTLSYAYLKEGVAMEAQFIFDLKLPVNFVPKPTDGEVEQFYLMGVEEVKQALIGGNFKENSAMVTFDFLLRKGIVNPDETPSYFEMFEKMHYSGI